MRDPDVKTLNAVIRELAKSIKGAEEMRHFFLGQAELVPSSKKKDYLYTANCWRIQATALSKFRRSMLNERAKARRKEKERD